MINKKLNQQRIFKDVAILTMSIELLKKLKCVSVCDAKKLVLAMCLVEGNLSNVRCRKLVETLNNTRLFVVDDNINIKSDLEVYSSSMTEHMTAVIFASLIAEDN